MEITPGDPNAQAAVWMREMDRRLAALEQANPLTNAAFTGRIRSIDAAGNDRVIIGELADGYGLEVLDDAGGRVLLVDEDGLRAPGLNLPVRAAQSPVSVASGSWTVTWEVGIMFRSHRAIRWRAAVGADAGTVVEARLVLGGSTATDVVVVTGPTIDTVEWRWAPPSGWALGSAGNPALVQMQLRRTIGAGAGHAYPPDAMQGTVGDLGATSTGL